MVVRLTSCEWVSTKKFYPLSAPKISSIMLEMKLFPRLPQPESKLESVHSAIWPDLTQNIDSGSLTFDVKLTRAVQGTISVDGKVGTKMLRGMVCCSNFMSVGPKKSGKFHPDLFFREIGPRAEFQFPNKVFCAAPFQISLPSKIPRRKHQRRSDFFWSSVAPVGTK